MSTGYFWNPAYLGHETPSSHVEHPRRAEALDTRSIMAAVPGLTPIAVNAHLGAPSVNRVHDQPYVQRVRTAFASNTRALDSGDTRVLSDTFDVALMSAAGAVSALVAVAEGRVQNAFAAIRPPGHHAGVASARGFCVFNNVALCARFAQDVLGYQRVLIIDWDVHPADGTSAIFYEDPDIHVVSLHQHGIFTETVGLEEQSGRGKGRGTIYNRPLPPGSGKDAYFKVFRPTLEMAAARCRPDIILISAGFDAHAGDPIGGMVLDESDFGNFTLIARSIADKHCNGRLVSVLEGGYHPDVLRRCVHSHLEALLM